MLYETLLCEMVSERPILQKISTMIDLSLENLSQSISVGEPRSILHAQIERINTTWNLVASKTGNKIKKDAFLTFLKEDKELSKLLL